ncbi:MAG: DUF1294 domain-containing protein [Ruminococcaceae bacterium]|nr:DUF1294 domain-containing protein [Oscillospiraceae bacterium]
MLELYTIFFLIMNALEAFLMVVDKRKAMQRSWRIAERDLLLMAFLGGAIGGFLTMYIVRHKTKHLSFVICMPLFTLLHIAITYYLISNRIIY